LLLLAQLVKYLNGSVSLALANVRKSI